MNPAEQFVQRLYATFAGRVPINVGVTRGFGMVYPLVFEHPISAAVGLVACAWNRGADPDLVQIYHVSVFQPRKGHGTAILTHLCRLADEFRVRLYVQPEPIGAPDQDPIAPDKLTHWYKQFGFVGGAGLVRPIHEA